MSGKIRTFSETRRGFVLLGLGVLLFIWVMNYFLNSVWSLLILVVVLAIVGWIQYFWRKGKERREQRRYERNLRSA